MNIFDSYKLHGAVIPGLLEKDGIAIDEKIKSIRKFTNTVHIDLIDGKFAENTTWMDPEPFKQYSKDMFFELHMMVEDPLQYLKIWAGAGIKRFIGHVEKMPDIDEFVAQGQLLGEIGLALDKQTPVERITIPLDDLDVVVIMCIQAGFSGQKFEPQLLEKVRKLRSQSASVPIEVDGGITLATIGEAKAAGANRFIANSFLFNSSSLPETQYNSLMQAIAE